MCRREVTIIIRYLYYNTCNRLVCGSRCIPNEPGRRTEYVRFLYNIVNRYNVYRDMYIYRVWWTRDRKENKQTTDIQRKLRKKGKRREYNRRISYTSK